MDKARQYNLYMLAASAVLLVVVYLLDKGNILSYSSYEYPHGFASLLQVFFLGIGASSALLLFFQPKIFTLWLKHIAWWYIPLAIYGTVTSDGSTGFITFYDKSQVAFLLMTLLFIITLVYAIVMNRKLNVRS